MKIFFYLYIFIFLIIHFNASCNEFKPLKSKAGIEYFNYNGKKIAYKYFNKDTGKKTILLIYGFCGNIEMMEAFCPFISREYKILVMDFPGHGYSEKIDHELTVESVTKIINELLINSAENEIYLIGYSIGGTIALNFYRKNHEKVKKMILWNTMSYFKNKYSRKFFFNNLEKSLISNYKYTITKICIPVIADLKFTPLMFKQADIISMYNDRESVISLLRSCLNFNAGDVLKVIRCDTLVMASRFDLLVPLTYVAKDVKEIKNAKFIVSSIEGHLGIISNPLKYSKIITDFF
ncbi:MAG: alpha/beta hydrolase [Spirochaetes bacterium]|nr:alpha/beta hydrolase [Spirochaetota bacterium]